MALKTQLTAEQQREYEKLLKKKLSVVSQGNCAGCSRALPMGYLGRATKWHSVDKGGGYVVQEPSEVWCKECAASGASRIITPKQKRTTHTPSPPPPTQQPKLDIKHLAGLLLGSCTTQPQTPAQITSKLAMPDDIALKILTKLVDLGKLKCKKGRYFV